MKILVSLSGGLVNAVYLDKEAAAKVQVVIADYDIEGTQCEHAEKMFALEATGCF
ncbi:hypothetical protein [Acidithiobacillus ferrianus]|uniref:hypothetical protein n=1 Tax=Acidithiobacillus ferrianus TaxID=2678518 RepID=UPI0034E3BF97